MREELERRRPEAHEGARKVGADVLAMEQRSNAVEGEAISSMEEVRGGARECADQLCRNRDETALMELSSCRRSNTQFDHQTLSEI